MLEVPSSIAPIRGPYMSLEFDIFARKPVKYCFFVYFSMFIQFENYPVIMSNDAGKFVRFVISQLSNTEKLK